MITFYAIEEFFGLLVCFVGWLFGPGDQNPRFSCAY